MLLGDIIHCEEITNYSLAVQFKLINVGLSRNKRFASLPDISTTPDRLPWHDIFLHGYQPDHNMLQIAEYVALLKEDIVHFVVEKMLTRKHDFVEVGVNGDIE